MPWPVRFGNRCAGIQLAAHIPANSSRPQIRRYRDRAASNLKRWL